MKKQTNNHNVPISYRSHRYRGVPRHQIQNRPLHLPILLNLRNLINPIPNRQQPPPFVPVLGEYNGSQAHNISQPEIHHSEILQSPLLLNLFVEVIEQGFHF